MGTTLTRILDRLRVRDAVAHEREPRSTAPVTTAPWIDSTGTLIVPTGCAPRHRWWDDRLAERLTIHEILVELGADAATHRAYCGGSCGGQG